MVYVSLTFWLLVVVLTAYGVHKLWAGVVKPKVFNIILLPGTLVAQTGHVLGLLLTGATVSNTTLIKDDESGDPETTPNPRPRIPILGPVIIGMLPILACGLAIALVAQGLGRPFLMKLNNGIVDGTMPTSLAGFWALLHDQIDLIESFVSAVLKSDLADWRMLLFLYLVICLSVRIAPFPGYLRGSLAAIIVLGILMAILASAFGVEDPAVRNGWLILNLVVATLLFLLMASLLVRGGVGLYRVIRHRE